MKKKLFDKLGVTKYDFEGFSARSIMRNLCQDIKSELKKCRRVEPDPIPETPDNYNNINEDYFNNVLSEVDRELVTEQVNNILVLSPIEYMRLEQFKRDHYKKCRCYKNGHYHDEKCYTPPTIMIQATGIGTGISIKCNNCGKVVDITDYDAW